MRPRVFPRRSVLLAVVLGGASALVAVPVPAQGPPAAPTVPVSATSQCVEGPGAPPADPTRVTRVVPGQPPSPAAPAPPPPPAEPSLDDPPSPGAPPPVLFEAGLLTGASYRLDDPPFLVATERAGFALGGSAFVWPSRLLAFGATYAHVALDRTENPPTSLDAIRIDHAADTLLAEARVVPFRFSSVALFASIGGGLAWQSAVLRGARPPINGSPGFSISCSAGSGAEFAFRGSVGVKARVTRAVSFLAEVSFVGYRLSADVLEGCAPGAGTAQTLQLRTAFTYDVDITGLVR